MRFGSRSLRYSTGVPVDAEVGWLVRWGAGCVGRKFWLNRVVQVFSGAVEILAGMLTSFRRIVEMVVRARPFPAIVAAARVKLNATVAWTSQATLAVNMSQGAALWIGIHEFDRSVRGGYSRR